MPGLGHEYAVHRGVGQRDLLRRTLTRVHQRHCSAQLLEHLGRRLDRQRGQSSRRELSAQLAGAGPKVQHRLRVNRQQPVQGGVMIGGSTALVRLGGGTERRRVSLVLGIVHSRSIPRSIG